MTRRKPRRGLLAGVLALPLALSGCLALEEPTPSPSPTPRRSDSPSPSPTASPLVREEGTLIVVAPADALSLVPPAANETEALLIDLLYDPLYRLDESLTPRPALAVSLPKVSDDGLTWTIDLHRDATFHDGRKVTADDVLFSLRVASSAACQLGRELCSTVADHLAGVEAERPSRVELTLRDPYAPFLAEVLARLPILSQRAVQDATAELVDAARRLGEDDPDALVTRITDATTADACFEAAAPDSCRLAGYREDLERLHRRARLRLPPTEAFGDPNGEFDEEAYVGELLERAAALAQVLTTSAADQHAAALELLDAVGVPLGGGPYELRPVDDPDRFTLVAHEGHAGGVANIERIEVHVVRDPSVAATLMIAGAADWLLRARAEDEAALGEAAGVVAARRPAPMQRAILFNVREGRLYADVRLRQAFGLCLDRAGLTEVIAADRPLSVTPGAAGSWAMPELPQPPRDPVRARALLDEAGWVPGADGIRERDGTRLSSAIAVRASRPDLYSFAVAAARELAECGIELRVEELDTVGDAILAQLQWPNDFDTLLVARPLGVDPDRDVLAFESAHATTESNPADANASGYASEAVDTLIAEARSRYEEQARRTRYVGLQTRLMLDLPFLPIWYDTMSSAVSTRVGGPDGPIDPSRPRYDWSVADWRLLD